ncbi:MAG: serine hydrolase [Elusimicrobiota bacterium]
MRKTLNGIRKILKFKVQITAGFLIVSAMVYLFATMMRPEPPRVDYGRLMQELQICADNFRGSSGILVKDLKTRQEVRINAENLFPSASLVKIPIMAAVYEAEKEGRLELTDELTLQRKYKSPGGGKLYRTRNGKKFTIKNLMERMIEESDNTATNMLVDALGFGYINQKFVEFGLKETDLKRGIMDLKWRDAGIENYTTAEEMAFLLEKIYRGDLVSEWASAEMLEILKKQKLRDRLPRMLPGDIEIAHKTGTLKGTMSDVGIVFTPEGDFIICVITDDIKSRRMARKFIGKIADWTYQFYKKG